MKSIKPKLGRGLGKLKDKFRGKIFPQFRNNGKNLDIKFSKKPMLVLSNKFKQSLSKKINFYKNKNNKKLSKYLENANCEGFIIRPDRFILASIKNLKDVTIPPECFTDKELIEIYKVHGRNLKIYDDILGDLIKNRKIKVK